MISPRPRRGSQSRSAGNDHHPRPALALDAVHLALRRPVRAVLARRACRLVADLLVEGMSDFLYRLLRPRHTDEERFL